ncbi:uncharacterized protein STEHIDRAFT_134790 [Stereum hirsutum FP-91666 SS1]|uniref:uncharacterized protein n=1 Tax=Stereum hirsutum (strain FP-91666) TaxID=721885 RepID=UPI000444A738|nr:uncharacterized protein STEHIDRAFT_134790 [Stereum hirsutum FP-91666 SS1]EIM81151.1 hypothetical protein STEHIDRAFT_134790 [Stereum hirsutum FP-91666 SS1]
MNPILSNPSQHQPSALSINPATLSAASTLGGTHPRLQPATPSSDATRRSTPTSGKRRRSEGANDSGDHSGSTPGAKKDSQKKKKANRACVHCQKAHLTCDDTRPCQRCIKRGIADTCTEGHRKRAKYLLDDEELEPFPPNDPLFNVPYDPSFPFGSEAANLEYSILSAILGNPSPGESHSTSTPPPTLPPSGSNPFAAEYGWGPNDSGEFLASPYASSSPNMSMQRSGSPGLGYQSMDTAGEGSSGQQQQLGASQTGQNAQGQVQRSEEPLHPLAPRWPPTTTDSTYVFWPGPPGRGRNAAATALANAVAGGDDIGLGQVVLSKQKTAQEVYSSVIAPYDYTAGYHSLMKYLPHRFEKNDILRIVRALAIFRPSLIAMQMPLTEEDEVFVEKCFQRSIIELDKLISYSGTPTVVWRRTGEICLVGPEFCMLTEWTKEELLGKGKYIWELFENQSVVEYWENFATHAFENTTQSVYSHCILLKPSGAPVPATFCFSIRRDIFDLPSLVIGQWLPLL